MEDVLEEFLRLCPDLEEMDEGEYDFAAESLGWTLHDKGEETACYYWDGSRRKSHYYELQFKAVADTAEQRRGNEARLRSISAWIQDRSEEGELPELEEGQWAIAMETAGGCLGAMTEDGFIGSYHLSLTLIYEESRDGIAG